MSHPIPTPFLPPPFAPLFARGQRDYRSGRRRNFRRVQPVLAGLIILMPATCRPAVADEAVRGGGLSDLEGVFVAFWGAVK